MAYRPAPAPSLERDAAEAAVRDLLTDLAGRKEFCVAGLAPPGLAGDAALAAAGFVRGPPGPYRLEGLRLHGAQVFVRNFENPDTEYPRLLLQWQTGTGKSIASISVAHEFVRQFRAKAAIGARAPTVFVISFTARETIQEDMLQHPEFGFVSAAEVAELRRLRAAAAGSGRDSAEARQLSGVLGALRRRITDRTKGGYYQFYGYKEFANRLLAVTSQGAARGFDVRTLYGRAGAGGSFGDALAAAVRRGDIRVDEDLLEEMRGGFLIADEIHNVYNMVEENNYGIAIQYALDALGAEAPRALFMSATITTGSAAGAIDLLNLLVPRAALPGGAPLRRADFFVRAASADAPDDDADADDSGEAGGRAAGGPPPLAPGPPGGAGEADVPAAAGPQLREGALERIAALAAGRVSFLLDADTAAYPRRLFVGDEVPGVPYLRLTLCPMAPFHARTLAHAQAEAGAPAEPARGGGGLAANAYTLYDMAFPNPAFAPDAAAGGDEATFGLYRSGETPARLAQAPEDWRAAAGVLVERGVEAGVSAGTAVISGAFLGPDRLRLYSTKFARVVDKTLRAIRKGPGKLMIYHHRVRMSGVLLLQEALRMSGLADETSAPTDATLCGVCGAPRAGHDAAPRQPPHQYSPARFVVAHSDVDRATMLRSIAQFNAAANADGRHFRVLIGSKIVRESLNFRAVRKLLVASLPTDYPTLVQIFGRVVRRGSHADLPEDQRDVRIYVFVSARADGAPSPELQRYVDKGREYLVIQAVERAFHAGAVDGFANWGRIRAALGWREGAPAAASLDALPYAPAVGPGAVPPPAALRTATFEAYGHSEREVATIAAVCRALFRARPVWTAADLWATVRAGAVRGADYDPALFDEGNFAVALEGLDRPAGEPPTCVVRAGPYYVRARVGPDGAPALDVESYLRDFPTPDARGPAPGPPRAAVRLADYLRAGERAGRGFAVRLREFEAAYLSGGGGAAPLELALVEFGAGFHNAMLRRLVAGERTTSDDARTLGLYRRFRIVVAAADVPARAFRGARTADPDEAVGFLGVDAATLRDPADGAWYSVPLAELGVGRRHRENDIVVGFVSAGQGGGGGLAGAARLKLRPPIQRLRVARAGDVRTLARGAVCETRPRDELEAYGRLLRAAAARAGVLPPALGGGCGCGYDCGCAGASSAGHGGADETSSEEDGAALGEEDDAALGEEAFADEEGDEAFADEAFADEDGEAGLLGADLGRGAALALAAKMRARSASDMCDAVRLCLLALEAHARATTNGLSDGLRWLYLFHDRPPTVSAIVGRVASA